MSGGRHVPLALALAIALAIVGCGGEKESSAESWANGVCTSLSEWVTDVDDAVKSLSDEGVGLDAAAVREAVDASVAATDELATDLERLGSPETEAAQEAEEELETLMRALRSQSEAVERALDENVGLVEFAATVAGAVSTGLSRLSETLENLRSLNQDAELADAFRSAEDCDSLRQKVEDLRS